MSADTEHRGHRMFYRWLYRPLMVFAHRYHWHYLRERGPFPDGVRQLYCDWCGACHTIKPFDPAAKMLTARTEGRE